MFEACASKQEIGELFDEFLNLNQPFCPVDSTDTAPSSPCAYNSDPSCLPARDLNGTPDSTRKRLLSSSEQISTTKRKSKRPKTDESDSTESCGGGDAVTIKKARRRKQNRMAAQTSREKKKKYLTGLEDTVADLQRQNAALVAELRAAQAENARLGGTHPVPRLETTTPVVVVKQETPPEIPDGSHIPIITFESAVGGDDDGSGFPSKDLADFYDVDAPGASLFFPASAAPVAPFRSALSCTGGEEPQARSGYAAALFSPLETSHLYSVQAPLVRASSCAEALDAELPAAAFLDLSFAH